MRAKLVAAASFLMDVAGRGAADRPRAHERDGASAAELLLRTPSVQWSATGPGCGESRAFGLWWCHGSGVSLRRDRFSARLSVVVAEYSTGESELGNDEWTRKRRSPLPSAFAAGVLARMHARTQFLHVDGTTRTRVCVKLRQEAHASTHAACAKRNETGLGLTYSFVMQCTARRKSFGAEAAPLWLSLL